MKPFSNGPIEHLNVQKWKWIGYCSLYTCSGGYKPRPSWVQPSELVDCVRRHYLCTHLLRQCHRLLPHRRYSLLYTYVLLWLPILLSPNLLQHCKSHSCRPCSSFSSSSASHYHLYQHNSKPATWQCWHHPWEQKWRRRQEWTSITSTIPYQRSNRRTPLLQYSVKFVLRSF